jgi:L-alanine-DL-glutamate epimerase-like enolase superfamily enzyme
VSAELKASIDVELKRLYLRHTWTTTMASSDYRDTVHLRYTRDGVTGFGEGAPIARYGTIPAAAAEALRAAAPMLAQGDPWASQHVLQQLSDVLGPAQRAAVSACDLALCDWTGMRLGVPVYRVFGLDPAKAPPTSFSVGIDTPEQTRRKVQEAEAYPILKIKVGLDTDEETIAAVRSVTGKPLRVDANEGWTDPEEAIRRINWMETQGVELIEQPMPAHMLAETRYVRSKVHLPIIADEACTSEHSIAQLHESYDGINVKLDKAGGILAATRWIATARAMEMQVMLGCMVSSSCACTAAAHLAPLADYVDLDGSLLIANDPFRGMTVRDGRLIMPDRPGLGLEEVSE